MLPERIADLKRRMIEYGGLTEGMIEKSVRGLTRKDPALLRSVIDADEPAANEREMEIEEIGTTVIAQYQPTARDLRTVLMVLKINNDLERVGDHAVNIAESALFLLERPIVKPLLDIPRMAEEAMRMLKDSITAFVREDALAAKGVCDRDNVVDGLRDQVVRELVTFMLANSGTIEPSLHLIRISNNLERVADLSTNVSEDVIFMVEGRVIKHRRDERRP